MDTWIRTPLLSKHWSLISPLEAAQSDAFPASSQVKFKVTGQGDAGNGVFVNLLVRQHSVPDT